MTKKILFLRNIFQKHSSEKIFGQLNFHLFSDFLGLRTSKIRKKTVTRHNLFFLMQNIQSLLSKNGFCLLVLMSFTFYFEIKRKNLFFLWEKGLLKWIRKGCFNWKKVQKQNFFWECFGLWDFNTVSKWYHFFSDYISELEMFFFFHFWYQQMLAFVFFFLTDVVPVVCKQNKIVSNCKTKWIICRNLSLYIPDLLRKSFRL